MDWVQHLSLGAFPVALPLRHICAKLSERCDVACLPRSTVDWIWVGVEGASAVFWAVLTAHLCKHALVVGDPGAQAFIGSRDLDDGSDKLGSH